MNKIVQETAKTEVNETISDLLSTVTGALFPDYDHECDHEVELKAKQVEMIRNGTYLYDPKILEEVAVLAEKLANIDQYVSLEDEDQVKIAPRKTKALLADLEDLLEMWEKFEDNFLSLRARLEFDSESLLSSSSSPEGSVGQSALGWALTMAAKVICPKTFQKVVDEKFGGKSHECVPLVKLPLSMERKLKAKKSQTLFNAGLELANEATDIYIAVRLRELQLMDLFHVSVVALVVTFLGRIALGIRSGREVDWKNKAKVRQYLLGMVLVGIEPNFAFENLISKSLKHQEPLPRNMHGEAQLGQDQVTETARKDYKDMKVDVVRSLLVILGEDVPQLVLQIIYFTSLKVSSELDYAFILAMVSTVLHMLNELNNLLFAFKEVPFLRTIINVRNLIFDSGKDEAVSPSLSSSKDGKDAKNSNDTETQVGVDLDGKKERIDVEKGLSTSGHKSIKDIVEAYLLQPRSNRSAGGLLHSSERQAFKEFEKRLSPALVQDNKFYRAVQQARLHKNLSKSKTIKEHSPSHGKLQSVLHPVLNRMDMGTMFSSVRSVEFSYSKSINADTIRLLARRCPSLQSLHLAFCESVDDAALIALEEETCPKLAHVVLNSCIKVTDVGIRAVANCCGSNLRTISLQNLPKITAESISYLATRCTRLQVLSLDQDPQVTPGNPQAQRKVNEVALVALGRFCGPTLRKLKLANTLDPSISPKALNKFLENCNPYMEAVSLSGNPSVDDQVLDVLSEKFRFLNDLHLSKTKVSDDGVALVGERCKILKTISLGDTLVTQRGVEDLVAQVDHLEHVKYEKPVDLLAFLLKQIGEHAARIGPALDESLLVSEEHDAVVNTLEMLTPLTIAINKVKNGQGSDTQAAELCDYMILIVDFYRRIYYRVLKPKLTDGKHGYTAEEKAAWEDKYVHEEARVMDQLALTLRHHGLFQEKKRLTRPMGLFEGSLSLLGGFTRRVSGFAFGAADDLADSDWKDGETGNEDLRKSADILDHEPKHQPLFPFPALAPFGVSSTREINLRINFQLGTYEFIVARQFRSLYASAHVFAKGEKALSGNISPLTKLGFALDDPIAPFHEEMSAYTRQKLYIPSRTKYYCFAYPIVGARTDFGFHEHLNHDDTALRLVTFGGFLYFDEHKQFLSASALSLGNTFSFNGPFELGQKAVRNLQNHNRWQKVVRSNLSKPLEYSYVFPQESLADKTTRHNKRGGFAYREQGSSVAYLYTLADLSDIIPSVVKPSIQSPLPTEDEP